MIELKPWHQLPGETSKAFAAFNVYKNLEPSERSISREVSDLGKSRSTIGGWSSRWNWSERVESWDEEQEIRLLAARIEQKARMDEEHLRIVRTARNKAVRALWDFDPADLSPTELRSWLVTFMEWERLILGEPESIEARRAKAAPADVDLQKEMEELMPLIDDMIKSGQLDAFDDDEEEDA